MRHSFLPLLLFSFFWNASLNAQDAPAVYPFAYQGQWGIVQEDRTLVLSPQLDSVGFFYDNGQKIYAIALEDNKYGLLKADGEWLAKPKLDSIGRMQYYAKNLHWAVQKGKLGLLNTNGKKGKWLVKPKFTQVTDFERGKIALAGVAINGRWGVINNEGKLIAECKYDEVKHLNDYSDYPDYLLTLNGEKIYIDAFGAPLSSERIRELEDKLEMWGDDMVFADDSVDDGSPPSSLRLIEQANPAGGTDVVLQKNGEEFQRVNVPQEYVVVEKKIDQGYNRLGIGFIMIKQNDKYGFWSREGHLATPVRYDRISWQRSNRYEQLAFLHQGQKVGLANLRGNLIFPANFTSITEFSYYFRLVHQDGYVGYGNYEGQVFLPLDATIGDK